MRLVYFVSLSVFCTTWSAAQTQMPAPIIESPGQATVYAAPTQLEFRLIRTCQESSVNAAMVTALSFEGELRKLVAERDLRPTEIEVSAPAVEDLNQKTVRVTARLRYPMSGFVNQESGPLQFATLCDGIASLGAALSCEAKGPLLDVQDRDSLIRSAVTAATENAYPAAEAIAGTLRSAVFTVDSVRVVEITWNQPPENVPAVPTLRQISCTAKVTVLYTVTGQ